MTDLEYKAQQAHKWLNFLHSLRDGFPRGLKLAVMLTAILSLTCLCMDVWVLSKLTDMEAIRDQSIKERRQMGAELHTLHLQVDSALYLNDHNTHTLDLVLLKLTQAELRGVQNKSSMDTIKSILIRHKLN